MIGEKLLELREPYGLGFRPIIIGQRKIAALVLLDAIIIKSDDSRGHGNPARTFEGGNKTPATFFIVGNTAEVPARRAPTSDVGRRTKEE
ncbi:hypothetical protein D3C77_423130 [compost metagenome]